MPASRIVLPVLVSLSAAAGCANSGREAAAVTFIGPETHDVAVTVSAAATVHFDTTLEVRVPGSESTISEEWSYTIHVLHGGAAARTVTCDAFNVGPGAASSQSGGDLRLTRSRLLGCTVPLDAGASTLRMTLAPTRGASSVTPVRVEVFVMQ
jgi:hypothetical protein